MGIQLRVRSTAAYVGKRSHLRESYRKFELNQLQDDKHGPNITVATALVKLRYLLTHSMNTL